MKNIYVNINIVDSQLCYTQIQIEGEEAVITQKPCLREYRSAPPWGPERTYILQGTIETKVRLLTESDLLINHKDSKCAFMSVVSKNNRIWSFQNGVLIKITNFLKKYQCDFIFQEGTLIYP